MAFGQARSTSMRLPQIKAVALIDRTVGIQPEVSQKISRAISRPKFVR